MSSSTYCLSQFQEINIVVVTISNHEAIERGGRVYWTWEDLTMPIHDWTRVRANRFHDFHQSWTIEIRNALNRGILPPGFFAMTEQITGGPEADVVALELTPQAGIAQPPAMAVETAPPQARIVARTAAALYARKANRITVRHPDGDVVAVIEIRLSRQQGQPATPSAHLHERPSLSCTRAFTS